MMRRESSWQSFPRSSAIWISSSTVIQKHWHTRHHKGMRSSSRSITRGSSKNVRNATRPMLKRAFLDSCRRLPMNTITDRVIVVAVVLSVAPLISGGISGRDIALGYGLVWFGYFYICTWGWRSRQGSRVSSCKCVKHGAQSSRAGRSPRCALCANRELQYQ